MLLFAAIVVLLDAVALAGAAWGLVRFFFGPRVGTP
jgi:hypothetical protein